MEKDNDKYSKLLIDALHHLYDAYDHMGHEWGMPGGKIHPGHEIMTTILDIKRALITTGTSCNCHLCKDFDEYQQIDKKLDG